MAGVNPEWSQLALDARTWPKGDSNQQVATSFPEAHLQRTLKLSVHDLEKFRDG